MTSLDTVLDVDREVVKAIYLKGLPNVAQHEQYLHLDKLIVRAYGAGYIVQETQITCPDIRCIRVTTHNPTIESFSVKILLRHVEGLGRSFTLNPDFAVFANMTELAGLRIDDGNLG